MIAGTILAFGRSAGGRGRDEAGDAGRCPAWPSLRRTSCCPRSPRAGRFRFPFLTLYLPAARGVGVCRSRRRYPRPVLERYNGDLVVGGQGEILQVGTSRDARDPRRVAMNHDDVDEPSRPLAGRGDPGARRGAKGRPAPDRGGRPVHRLRDRGPRADCSRGSSWPGSAWATSPEVEIVPGELGGPADARSSRSSPTTRCRRAWRASTRAGRSARGSSSRWVRGRCARSRGREPIYDMIGFREEPRTRSSACSRPGSRRTPAVVALIARRAGSTPAVGARSSPRRRPASRAGSRWSRGRSRRPSTSWPSSGSTSAGSSLGPRDRPRCLRWRADDLAAIGRTNDAVLYGGRVVLYVTGDDASLEEIGPKVPSSSSRDFGEPFAAIFARYNHDFYAVDPHLFSPAEVVFQNLETGRVPRLRRGGCTRSWRGRSGRDRTADRTSSRPIDP